MILEPFSYRLQVFVVFSNHLDVGYTDNLDGSCAGAVVNRYFDDHFPNAIKTADEFRQVRSFVRMHCSFGLRNDYTHELLRRVIPTAPTPG